MSSILTNSVKVAPRFQRSIRIDHDLGIPEALEGYVMLSSATQALKTLINQVTETPQRAFTWTGPYGGGKSSLALLVATLLGPAGNAKNVARKAVGDALFKKLSTALPSTKNGWLTVPVVGHRGNIVQAIGKAFQCQCGKRSGRPKDYASDPRKLIEDLCQEATKRGKNDGVVILIDEMGKFLEGSAERGEDIYFLQELAEAASRCEGNLVLVAILHQAFEEYASRLGRQTRDEWSKIQGRFSDIPISSAVDEVLDLVGRAIERQKKFDADKTIIDNVASAVRRRRPALPAVLSQLLDSCWPLHPVSAMLLGPISKHRFGQNERSCFAFLTSAEPSAFQDYLHSTSLEAFKPYEPAQLWDYLQANLEPSILASPDGHRWAQAAEAVDRCISRGTEDHVRLTKTIAVIDLFKSGSGLAAEEDVLYASLAGLESKSIKNLLDDLENWSLVVYRKHLSAYGVFAGSDFDIETAIADVQDEIDDLDYSALNRLANVQPILAKALYHKTGALWWLDAEIISLEDASERASKYDPQNGAAGCMFLAIPSEEFSTNSNKHAQTATMCALDQIVVIGVPDNSYMIREHAKELLALEHLKTKHPELEGDQVARKELHSRISIVTSLLQNELHHAFTSAHWHAKDKSIQLHDSVAINRFASEVINARYGNSPHIHNELLNRQNPSSNAVSARKALLHAMADQGRKQALGFEGFPAERGLYETTLRSLGLHRPDSDGQWSFQKPNIKDHGETLLPMWEAAEVLFETSASAPISLDKLFEKWRQPPYGLKEGLLPIYVVAFLLSQANNAAIYHKGFYQPNIDALLVDRLLQKPSDYSIRKHVLGKYEKTVLSMLAKGLTKATGANVETSPLGIARRLVKVAYALPTWTKITSSVSKPAQEFRDVLLNAKDPIKTLFEDLPKITSISGSTAKAAETLASRLLEFLEELEFAYPQMLMDLRTQMVKDLSRSAMSFKSVHKGLFKSAEFVKLSTGDPKLHTFALRLLEVTEDPISMIQIAGLLISKPPRDWTDEDTKLAKTSLAEMCLRFRQEAVLQEARSGASDRETISFVYGAGENAKLIVAEPVFELSDKEFKKAQSDLNKYLGSIGLSVDAKLALIAKTGVKLASKIRS